MEQELREFLAPYLGRGTEKKDIVTQEAIDLLVIVATLDHCEQEIMDYGKAHPEAPFWDFLQFGSVGLAPDDDGSDLLDDE